MRFRQYLLIMLFFSPLLLGIYTHPAESLIIVPENVTEFTIQGNGNSLVISTTQTINLNLSLIESDTFELIDEVTINAGEEYSYTIEQPSLFHVSVLATTVAEITIEINGIPQVFFIIVGVIGFLILVGYRKELLRVIGL